MKNLTLAVPEETLQRFRVHAANKKTTVNALIRQFMEDEVGGEARRKAAIARMLDRSSQSSWSPDEALPRRNDIYADRTKPKS